MLNEIKAKTKERMLKTIQSFHDDMKGVRTGRANSSLLDGIVVNIYGGHQKLNQVAGVSAIDNKTLSVKVWDATVIGEVKNAIINANLNLNPVVEGNTIRIVLPDLTQETREKLVKLLHQFSENARVAIRNIRRDVMEEIEEMKKNKEISEDDFHVAKKEIQNITDDNVKKVDDDLSIKEKDILHH
ncbi:Ribosome-recycling factor [Wolbachia endosymbiont of Drosophila simulans wNo]|uniref:Ribosome-recycling factor n=2 Tax=unclassified Wolbachia TaxID=2640676 RepID=A0A3B0IVE6_9RICK|nr:MULTISPECIES: ribosome recycling factor [unclassified Wolbachia]MBR9983774.1 ribosome recycling factor [Wolbachia endosymbiont of Homalodisca vitripennis]MEC4734717.1 ribosome recycling factor [Wolbachia endosymbiont of Halictus tumulorum]AGJ99284.1 Ribosome-recycling factor [Wolbachia endosymbiont of Drosophila simulans wNo]MCJ7454487.1 ribosome recycling factor [Wolbachia endosymbiont of Homalodisca vitripennis]MCJ7476163.1 ribosome recycling factor [Wolbachia endosymbiont of Homalodisca 